MDNTFESLPTESSERKEARAVALWATLDALPDNDPDRLRKARRAYLADLPDPDEPTT